MAPNYLLLLEIQDKRNFLIKFKYAHKNKYPMTLKIKS